MGTWRRVATLGVALAMVALAQGAEPCLRGPTGTLGVGKLSCAACSHDGRWVAVALETGVIRVFEAATWKEFLTLTAHTDRILDLAWSPDGTVLASAAGDGSFLLWDTQTGRELHRLPTERQPVWWIAWSPDGRWVAGAFYAGGFGLWNPETGELLRFLEPREKMESGLTCPTCVPVIRWWRPTHLVWRPDGRVLAGASRLYDHTNEGEVVFLDVESGATSRVLLSPVTTMRWSPLGNVLATGHRDGYVRIWDGASFAEVRSWAVDPSSSVGCMVWDPQGAVLACLSGGDTVTLWNAASGEEIAASVEELADGRLLLSGPEGAAFVFDPKAGALRWWAAPKEPEQAAPYPGHLMEVNCVAWSPDGTTLASGSADGRVLLWETERWGMVGEIPGTEEGPVRTLAWSADGERLAVGRVDCRVSVIEVLTGRETAVLAGREKGAFWVMAWSPDEDLMAILSLSRTGGKPLVLWDLDTGSVVELVGPVEGNGLAWSPDGGILAYGMRGGAVGLWLRESGELFAVLTEPSVPNAAMVTALAWSPDGKVLGVGRKDGRVEFWGVGAGEKIREVFLPGDWVDHIRWSPDGSVLLAAVHLGSNEGVLALLDACSGEVMCSVSVGPVFIFRPEWSPDGRQIAVGMGDWTVTLWDVVAASTRREEGE